MRATGLIRDRESTREHDHAHRNYDSRRLGLPIASDVVQPIAWIHDQLSVPSCGGHAAGAGIDAVRGLPPWASSVSIWREARRRQGELEQIDEGTRLEYVFDGLEMRGWDPYRPGEDDDAEEAGLGAPDAGDDLFDELAAHDHRSRGLKRYRIFGFGSALLDAIDDALDRERFLVEIGIGTREPFYDLEPDVIATERHLGGDANGHALRVFARIVRNGRRLYGLQNSWGEKWGGCRMPDGRMQPGCCLADESVIVNAWEIYAAEVKT